MARDLRPRAQRRSVWNAGPVATTSTPMDETPTPATAPAEWLEALAESDAQLAAGQIVGGEDVMRELDECIAQLEAKRMARLHRRATSRR
jgi:hypothetical protein